MPKHDGIELKIKRIRRRLLQQELADAMNVTRVRIGQIEGMESVTPLVMERYLTGLSRASIAKKGDSQ